MSIHDDRSKSKMLEGILQALDCMKTNIELMMMNNPNDSIVTTIPKNLERDDQENNASHPSENENRIAGMIPHDKSLGDHIYI